MVIVSLCLRLIRDALLPPSSTLGEYAMTAKSRAPNEHKICTPKSNMRELTCSLPLAFLIGHIMGITFRLGGPTTFARSEKLLLIASRCRCGVHD